MRPLIRVGTSSGHYLFLPGSMLNRFLSEVRCVTVQVVLMPKPLRWI
jgi:hypothetical protein